MEIFSYDFMQLLTFSNIIAIAIGTLIGLFVGALPGVGPPVGVALIIPTTYTMEPLAAILMLVALYMAAEYGGSISAIVLGVPGTAAAVATAIDGNAMAKKGYPGKALGYALISSSIGGIIGAIILMMFAIPLSNVTYQFGDPEMFLIALIGLLSISTLDKENISKTVISILFGLLIGTIGLDVFSGIPRFTVGIPSLYDGLSLVAVLVGLFAISEVFNMVMGDLNKRYVTDTKNLKTRISFKEFRAVFKTIFKSSLIGTISGIIPGMGASPGAWFSYMEAKRSSKNPKKFGDGEPNGIAGPEASNNAVVGGALVPFLTLGIPGSPTIAIIASAFIIQGIQPGPEVFSNNQDLVFGIFWGLLIAAISLYAIGKYTTSLWARLLVIPNYMLAAFVMVFALIGAYAARGMFIDVWIAILFGILGYFLKKLGYSIPGFTLAFVLATLVERSFRRSLMLTQGNYNIFLSSGYSITLFIVIVLLILIMLYRSWRNKKLANKSN